MGKSLGKKRVKKSRRNPPAGDSVLLVYLRRGDDSDEALMSITYDRRRSSRHEWLDFWISPFRANG